MQHRGLRDGLRAETELLAPLAQMLVRQRRAEIGVVGFGVLIEV